MKSRYFYRRAASSTHISKLIPQLEKGEAHLREISSEIGMTYQNLSQCMQDAHIEGLIDRKRVNNRWEFELTEKGKALAELCKGIKMVIENWEESKTVDQLNKLSFGDQKKQDKENKGDDDKPAAVITPANSGGKSNGNGQ